MGRGIEQLRSLFADAHVRGEWFVGKNNVFMVIPSTKDRSEQVETIFDDPKTNVKNRLLIASAVNSLPAIFDVVDAARKMVRGNNLSLLERYSAAIELSDTLNALDDVVSFPPQEPK